MKIIVAGCRNFNDWVFVEDKVFNKSKFGITEIVSGGAKGVDTIAISIGYKHRLPVRTFEAKWKVCGYAAGPIRNKEMAEYADGLIAFWDGTSKGTGNMISQMKKLNKPVEIVGIKV